MFTVWDQIGMSTRLKGQRALLEDFFDAAAAEVFLGPDALADPSTATPDVAPTLREVLAA